MTSKHDDRLVQVRVLGPVDVVTCDGPTPLGGPMEKTLFAALALSANRAVSADQLAQILWGDTAPASRDNTLQSYVSRVRHLVGHDRVRSEDRSYRLIVAPGELDAVVFERLVTEAADHLSEPAACLDTCRRAQELWRGVAFGNLAGRDPFRLESVRLDEIRVYAAELRLESEIALGHEEIVVGALEALAHEYPYRERIWHLLIAALALCGRRTEAMRAYHDLQARLADVGLEPIAELRALERAVLSEDADLRTTLPGRSTPAIDPLAVPG